MHNHNEREVKGMENTMLVRKIYMECPLCDKTHEIEERKRIVTTTLKGEKVAYEEHFYFCENADEEENEFETEEVPDIINAELAKEITGEDVGELYKMGCAVTIRNSLVHNGSELCLDKTTYFDKTDYEVKLSNGWELKFDSKFNLIDIDN